MLPNEACFILLLATLFFRLAFHPSQPIVEALGLGLYLFISLWLYVTQETPLKKRIKWILPIASVPILYFSLNRIMNVLGTPKQDSLLQKLDEILVRGSLSLKMQFLRHPVLTEGMYICYILFFAYVIASLVSLLKHGEKVKKSFYSGLFTIYWVGFLGYCLVPGDGPYIAMRELLGEPLREGLYFARPIHDLIMNSNNHADVFPSLHCSVSAFCLFFDLRHNRARFWRYLPLSILIWVSTIYLSYHYFVDILVGFALTYIALKIAHMDRSNPLGVVQQ
jgi:membrane-associated phospholipid phosphatase